MADDASLRLGRAYCFADHAARLCDSLDILLGDIEDDCRLNDSGNEHLRAKFEGFGALLREVGDKIALVSELVEGKSEENIKL